MANAFENLDALVAEMDQLNLAVMVNLSGKPSGDVDHLEAALNSVKPINPPDF